MARCSTGWRTWRPTEPERTARTPRGFELDTYELVPAGTDPAELSDLPGQLSAAAVAVLILRWTDRRLTPHEITMRHATGRLTGTTEKVKVWQAWAVRDGRLDGRLSGEWDRLNDAARAVSRQAARRR